jgi:hypothetical protein
MEERNYSTFRFSFVEVCKLTILNFFMLKKIIKHIVVMLELYVSAIKIKYNRPRYLA